MCKSFSHLHNHSEYSLLDGANRISGMIRRAKEEEMEAIALTDHGVMFGAMNFYWEAKKQGVKPIIGMEAYVDPTGIASRKRGNLFHLLLLAKDIEGYRNLSKLATIAALDGFYGKPRVDHEILRRHSAGIISTTTCLGSEVCQALLDDDYGKARETAELYMDIFGAENYYVELMDHGLPEQMKVNKSLRQIAKELRLPTIATNDAHYGTREDADPHDILLCIQTGAQREDPKRFRFTGQEFYLKTQAEMAALFPDDLEALERTGEIVARCNVELDKQRAPMPQPNVPEGLDSPKYLRELCLKGMDERREATPEAMARLDYELKVIGECGFDDYMLLVREFAQATRERDIYFGVRGSAAGSLVGYLIGITDVDPVEYDLTFERFLNPERVSMPDIDMDFEDQRRGEIIDWVTERYGSDKVAQIITFGTMGAKAAIKDVGRVLGYEPKVTDLISKKIPLKVGMTLQAAYDENPEFREIVEETPENRHLYETALHMEGRARNAGVHAAGVVISKDPLVDYVPLYRGTDGQAVTSYEMKVLEKMGMLKMDFLGLSNLTVLAKAVANVKATEGIDLDVKAFPEDDPKVWSLLAKGDTTGVFQLESDGMTRYIVQLKPESIRELSAMIALFRPGPMGEIPKFIDLKHGRRQPTYEDERMEPTLRETFGVIVYQDQVLKLVQTLAGFTLGRADLLRRAMGKKDAKAMKELGDEFYAGTDANGISRDCAERIWELLIPFAGYAFNKAHSVCYAILSFQTAWLKANYPVEYMAALMAVYREKEDRIVAFIDDCRRRGIPVMRPDVNASDFDFRIQSRTAKKKTEKAIRFGLGAIKGLGDGLAEAILKEREENGPYSHLFEFCERTKVAGLNRTALDALIKAGAFDSIDSNRTKLLYYAEAALMYADAQTRDRAVGQGVMAFDDNAHAEKAAVYYRDLPDVPAGDRLTSLAHEKEAMGVYLSDHPLRGMEGSIARASTVTCDALEDLEDGVSVRIAGIISAIRIMHSKKTGQPMCSFTLEDFSGQAKLMAFSNQYGRFRELLVKDGLIRVSGRMGTREGRGGETERELRIDDIAVLEGQPDVPLHPVIGGMGTLTVSIPKATAGEVRRLKNLVLASRGEYRLRLVVDDIPPIDTPHWVSADDDKFLGGLRDLLPRAKVEVSYSERAFEDAR